jgi:hypothetical protein
MAQKKRKVEPTGILIAPFSIGTTKPMTFINELNQLCKKHAVKNEGKEGKDYYFRFVFTS